MFLYLLLAHFLADYPLQTGWMVRNKRKLWVLLLHVLAHLAVLVLIVGPARSQLWPYLIVLVFIHFWLDVGKNIIWSIHPDWVNGPYLIDQGLHLISIALVSTWITRAVPAQLLPEQQLWMVITLGFLLGTYVWYISEMVLTTHDPQYQQLVILQAVPRMVSRGLIIAVLLGMSLWLASLGEALAFKPALPGSAYLLAGAFTFRLPYLKGSCRSRMLATDLSVSAACVLLMLVGMRSLALL